MFSCRLARRPQSFAWRGRLLRVGRICVFGSGGLAVPERFPLRARMWVVALAVLGCALAPAASGRVGVSWAPPRLIDHSITENLSAVSCPTVALCVAVDKAGQEVTFDPRSGRLLASAAISPGAADSTVVVGGDSPVFGGIACVSSRQCTAVDIDGREITFQPRAPLRQTVAMIDAGSALRRSVSRVRRSACARFWMIPSARSLSILDRGM